MTAKRKEYENYDGSQPIFVNERNEVWDRESSRFLNLDVFLRHRDRSSPTCGAIIGTKRVKKVLGRIRDAEGRISAEHEIFNPTEITGGGPHPEQYDLTSPHLKEIFQAVNNHYLGDNDEVDAIVFSGGSGKVDNHTTAAFDTDYRGRVDNSY
ncbi:12831_t:CDS:2 [Funneliformis geosporum]|uniref:12831_t:CDS:1 n=1 Tax=Funneliformis geosporum TaxID=1117311 RepID=A0A9W4WRE6_9GLOM|nr:12831_t:CDS:2 [Funneliformis geosporum]